MTMPSYEDYLRESARANAPKKTRAASDAINTSKKLFDMYNRGLLTPHDLADNMLQAWLEAEGESR